MKGSKFMRFTVEKNLLQTAIMTASRASAVKSAVPALEGLLVEASGTKIKISDMT
jgi:DNA polymerase III sliding clamp (beta) subunit (PCNA family)